MTTQQVAVSAGRRTITLGKHTGPLPGILLALVLAVPAKLVERFVPVLPAVVVSMLLGIAVANLWHLSKPFQAGARFCTRYVLRTAIILLGAGLSFQAIVATGAQALAVILICFSVAFALAWLLARAFRLSGRIGTLIGAGTAICGASAIVACSPLVEAEEEETAYAIATIFTFNLVALVVYPVIGVALALSPYAFGVWAGTAVNDTSAVVATGYAFDKAAVAALGSALAESAGAVATVVKLTRTVLLVPLALVIAVVAAALRRRTAGEPHRPQSPFAAAVGAMPWFILGFLALAALNTTGLIAPAGGELATEVAKLLIVVVLAAVGLGVNLRSMGRLGLRPLAVGFVAAATMALVSIGLIFATGIGSA